MKKLLERLEKLTEGSGGSRGQYSYQSKNGGRPDRFVMKGGRDAVAKVVSGEIEGLGFFPEIYSKDRELKKDHVTVNGWWDKASYDDGYDYPEFRVTVEFDPKLAQVWVNKGRRSVGNDLSGGESELRSMVKSLLKSVGVKK